MTEYFEGPEKKLEVVVDPEHPSLRSFGHEFWEEVVRASCAQVLSRISNDQLDAYLLSESSLFVSDERLTLITCGRTKIVDAAELILDRVPPEQVALVILERKNEHFPRHQPTGFRDDARRLSERLGGRALRFGREHSHAVRLYHSGRAFSPRDDDATLEILMHGIDPTAAGSFLTEGASADDARARARASGVTHLLPGFQIDDHMFEPAGYSLNAIRGGDYYTVHVTPEAEGSYVSFETNMNLRCEGIDPEELVARVVQLFRPESFDVFSFEVDAAPLRCTVEGYRMRQHVTDETCGYRVSFLHFYSPPLDPVAPQPVRL